MRILNRYILSQYAQSFLFGTIAFIALFILIDVIEKINYYIDRKASFFAVAGYYLYLLPENIKLTAPISALLAALFVTGNLSKQTELTAMKASGISLYRILVPFFIVSAVITAVDFLFSGWIVPYTTREKQKFESVQLGKTFWTGGSRSNFNILDKADRLVSIGYFNDAQSICYNVSVQQFEGSSMRWRIDAKQMIFNTLSKRWVLQDAICRNFLYQPEQLIVESAIDSFSFSFTLRDLRENTSALDLLTLPDHRAFIEKRQRSGFEAVNEALVKYHSKIAFPLACLIVVLIGVPLSATKKRSGLALEAGISILIGFIYIGLQQTFATLGYKGEIPPWLAAWFPNLLFLAVGLVLLWKAQK
ncbi:MAG: LPS export ABC transporter permease LptG [Chloroherpetonaceae bacterium]|nr:LPS export ABC transporter permease LptG [Chloroherpetonaceae bacterium]